MDPGVRGLVEALNAFPGVTTVESCEGHARGAPAWVAFATRHPDIPQRIATAIAPLLAHPRVDPRSGYDAGPVQLHPYLAYGTGLEWRLVVRAPTEPAKARLLRALEAALREHGPAPLAARGPRQARA